MIKKHFFGLLKQQNFNQQVGWFVVSLIRYVANILKRSFILFF